MRRMMHPGLKFEIPLNEFSGQWIFWADINGDGRCEAILHEHAAMLAGKAFAYDSAEYPNWTTPADQAQFCVTACDLEGKKLWQIGRPWTHVEPYRSHGGPFFGTFADSDGDGSMEHIFLFKDDIWSIDALSGQVKHRHHLESDAFCDLGLAHFQGRGHPPQIWIKCGDSFLPGHTYCNPLRVLTIRFERYWPDLEIPRAGHLPVACDIDGDGCDEFFHGACLIDHDGKILWKLDLPAHVDEHYLADINEDGRMEVILALCGGGGGIVADALTGHILWQVPRKHCGFASVGKYRDDLPGMQVCFGEDSRAKDSPEGTALYDAQGRLLWRAENPHAVPRTLHWPTSCGKDTLVMNNCLVDGTGKKIFTFPVSVDTEAISRRLGNRKGSMYDWGGGGEFTAKDVDGDGVEEAVFNTREKVWVFGL